MDPAQAQNAIDQNPWEHNPDGFWAYVIGPYENSRGGNVLHFWPVENETRRRKVFSDGRAYSQPQWAATEFVDRVAVCGITNENRFTPTDDFYHLHYLPKCKKCLRRLMAVSNASE